MRDERNVTDRPHCKPLPNADPEEEDVDEDIGNYQQEGLSHCLQVLQRQVQLLELILIFMGQCSSMDQPRTHYNRIPPVLNSQRPQANNPEEDKEDTQQQLDNEISPVQPTLSHRYTRLRIPKIMLKSPPRKMVQGTTLYGKKCASRKKRGPKIAAIHSDITITFITLRMWYL